MHHYDMLFLQVPNYGEMPYLVGIGSLAAFLRKHGKRVKCVDPFEPVRYSPKFSKSSLWKTLNDTDVIEDKFLFTEEMRLVSEQLLQFVQIHTPRFVGFSIMHGTELPSLFLANKLKQKFPALQIVFGGPLTNSITQEKLALYSSVDFVVIGEGEWTTLALLESNVAEDSLDAITGLLFQKTNAAGEQRWQKNPERMAETNIERFCFADYSDYQHNRYFQESYQEFFPVSFSRGCPFTCSFCTVNRYALRYRNFTVEDCVRHIQQLVDRGVTKFNICDSICNGNPRWLVEFCQQLVARKMKINWVGNFRLQRTMKDPAFIRLVLQSGCSMMVIGLESASELVLRDMKKLYKESELSTIFDVIRQESKGRKVVGLQLIVGYPNETEESFHKTLEFVKHNADVVSRIISCSAFMLGETEAAMQSFEKIKVYYQGSFNWASTYSSPQVRIQRMLQAKEFFEREKLTYRLYYLRETIEAHQTNQQRSERMQQREALSI